MPVARQGKFEMTESTPGERRIIDLGDSAQVERLRRELGCGNINAIVAEPTSSKTFPIEDFTRRIIGHYIDRGAKPGAYVDADTLQVVDPSTLEPLPYVSEPNLAMLGILKSQLDGELLHRAAINKRFGTA